LHTRAFRDLHDRVMILKSLRFFSLILSSLILVGCSPTPPPTVTPDPPVATPAPAARAELPPAAPIPRPTPPLAAPEKLAAAKTIRIIAWNLEWFPGKKPTATPEAEAQQMTAARAALAELQPDVLLLEEIRDWDKAHELCQAVTGLQVHIISRFESRPQNQVVASRFPADSGWSDVWKSDGVTPPRGYSFAALELPGPRYLLAYALHLKSNLGDLPVNIQLRQAATRQLLVHAESMIALYHPRGPVAVIVGGDLNTSLDDPKFAAERTLQAITAAGFHWTHDGVPVAERTTIPAGNGFPDNCFDHLFTLGLGRPRASVKSYPDVSDHNPVILDVDLTTADFDSQFDPAKGLALLARVEPPAASAATVRVGILKATNTEGLKAAAGQIATVQGRVENVGGTKTGSIHFINFDEVERGGFVGIVRQEHYQAISAALGGDLKTVLTGKNVTLRGPIALFKDGPQIVITAADQIVISRP
jgi:endonuclease/exonuclease/phosphatase family metal-dependent hydrolase